MALYKADKKTEGPTTDAGPATSTGRVFGQSNIVRARAEDLAPPPESEAPFSEGIQVPRAEVESRVVNRQYVPRETGMPALKNKILIGDPAAAQRTPPPQQPAGGGGYDAPPPPPQPVVQQLVPDEIIQAARQQAEQIVAEAQAAGSQVLTQYQQQAQQFMEQAQMQVQQMAEQIQGQAQQVGLQQGYEQGLQQGALAAQQQVYSQLVESRDIFIQAIRQRQLMLTTCEPELARLAVKVSEKLIGQELTTNPDVILGIVRVALTGIGDREHVTIRVHPADYDKVVEHRASFEKMVEGLKKFEVLVDAAIDQGGCAVETNLGNIDARLNTRVAALLFGLEEQAQLHETELHEAAVNLEVEVPDVPPPPEAATMMDATMADHHPVQQLEEG